MCDYMVTMWFLFYSDSEEKMKALEADLLSNIHTSKVNLFSSLRIENNINSH